MDRQSLPAPAARPAPTGTRLRMAVALVAGAAMGAATVGAVYAAAGKMPAYTIAEIDITDAATFQQFAQRNMAGVSAAGGHFLALRGKVAAENGTPPKDVALIAWDSLDQAIAYFGSPTFKELIPLRDKGANVRLFHVEGLAMK